MQLKLPQGKSISALLLIAPFFFWGTAMVAMKGAIADTTPFFLAGFRLVPAGFLVLLAAFLSRRKQPKTWQAWLWIGLFALVDGTLFQGFLAQGLTRTGAGLGSVMIDSQPLAVALLAWILFGEKIGLIGAIGLLLGVVGISLLGLPQEWISQWVDPTAWGAASFSFVPLDLISSLFDNGQWLMLMAALSMAIGTVMVRYVSRHVDPVVATGWHMILGGLPLFLLSDWLETDQWTALTSTDWLALGYSTIFGSALSYGLFFYFASQGNLTSLSSLTFLTPVFALTFGNFFLAENLEPYQWLGVALTLVSIYAINQRDSLTAKLWPAADDSDSSQALTHSVADRTDSNAIAAVAVGLADDSSSDRKISSP